MVPQLAALLHIGVSYVRYSDPSSFTYIPLGTGLVELHLLNVPVEEVEHKIVVLRVELHAKAGATALRPRAMVIAPSNASFFVRPFSNICR